MELGEAVVGGQDALHLTCQLEAHLHKPQTVGKVPVLAWGTLVLTSPSHPFSFVDLVPQTGEPCPVATDIGQPFKDLRDPHADLMNLLPGHSGGECSTAQALEGKL